ncbi:MAG TPA: TRAP transporter small permease [Arenimonas sp.]|nr:TRAP transporter small permease [Arenimonas sp.]
MPDGVLRWLHRGEDLLLAGLLGALLLLAVTQIGLRLFFDSGLAWAEPMSRSGVFWLAMLGGLAATRSGKHIAIDALPRVLPPLGRRVMWVVAQLSASGVCALLAWHGAGLVRFEFEAPVPWVAGISSGWPMMVLPLGFALMALRFLVAAACKPIDPTHDEGEA